MTTLTPNQTLPAPSAAPGVTDEYGRPVEAYEGSNYLTAGKGVMSWLLTLDHKRIGLLYMFTVLTFFLVGGIFAIILRTELIAPGATLTLGDASDVVVQNRVWNVYNHMFTLHGAVMVFLFIIPAIPAILGNFVLPLMLGAKDVAFPRLNLMSWYCYMGGAIFFLWILVKGLLVAIFPGLEATIGGGGLDTGWTFYTPYSTTTNTAVVAATAGAFILGFSSILTGVNFIATIHMLRPRGMGWFQLPLLLWALYATAVIQILATPVLAITLLLLMAERILGVGIFDPNLGGDPVLYQHFFWFYSHPAVYIMILPAFGIISELVSVHSRKHIFGYKFIAFSSLAIAFFGFLVWGHHMFTSGQSVVAGAIFSLISFSIAVPSGVKVFNWLTTMYNSRIRLSTPMLYAMGFIWLFAIGGLTGMPLAAISTDIIFHDTYFIVAHFHYVMVGSTMFAFLGGMYHWWPKIWGKMYNEAVGLIGCRSSCSSGSTSPSSSSSSRAARACPADTPTTRPSSGSTTSSPPSARTCSRSASSWCWATGSTRSCGARRPPPTRGAPTRWNGSPPARRRTTTSSTPPRAATPTTSPTGSTTSDWTATSSSTSRPRSTTRRTGSGSRLISCEFWSCELRVEGSYGEGGVAMATVERFEDLEVWRRARALTRGVYGSTKLPRFSRDFGLRDQICRASVSIMSNIAEGFERESNREFSRFLKIAKGSAAEVRSQLYVALDENYIDRGRFDFLKGLTEEISRMIAGLLRYLATVKDK